jgi:hypothetical protein
LEPKLFGSCRQETAEPSSNRRGKSGDFVRDTFRVTLIDIMQREIKITLGEMRSTGVRGLVVFCADYQCSHSVKIDTSQWGDDVRISDLEPRFVCKACGHTYGTWMTRYGNLDTYGLVRTKRWKNAESADHYNHTMASPEARRADLLPVAKRAGK